MLTIYDPRDPEATHCDGVSRRNFIKVGALGAAGLTLPELLSLEANAGIRNSTKSVILVYLVGGPPHQDLFDLKPEAPVTGKLVLGEAMEEPVTRKYTCIIPAGSTATLTLMGKDARLVNGKSNAAHDDWSKGFVYQIGSGEYTFEISK